jgi:predicted amidohydrolase YtcJ
MDNMSRTIHISNGNIVLQTRPLHFAQSLTIIDGRVADIDADAPFDSDLIDLHGKTALPGFIDSHLHLVQGASGMGDFDLSGIHSKEEFQSVLLEEHAKISEGSWLVGYGWNQEKLGGSPDKSWIPESISVPTLCYRIDFHSAVLNDIAIECLPIKLIINETGGDSIHEGIVKEDALYSFVCPEIPSIDIKNKCARTTSALREFQSKGITLIGSMEELTDINDVLTKLPLSTLMRIGVIALDEPTKENIDRCLEFDDGDFIRVFGFKSFLDGSLGSRTAKMYEQWCDADGDGLWAGVAARDELVHWITKVASSGFAPVMHAIGDAAVGRGLDAILDIETTCCPRIEHAQFISDNDIAKIKNIMFGVQPLHQPDDVKIAKRAVGESREKLLHNWRRMLDAGARLSFGSDWPVANADPIAAMKIAIDQGLTFDEVLFASTEEAALSLNMPLAGTLVLGSYGDVVVLDCNPYECDWKTTQPQVCMTILDGSIVYEKEET